MTMDGKADGGAGTMMFFASEKPAAQPKAVARPDLTLLSPQKLESSVTVVDASSKKENRSVQSFILTTTTELELKHDVQRVPCKDAPSKPPRSPPSNGKSKKNNKPKAKVNPPSPPTKPTSSPKDNPKPATKPANATNNSNNSNPKKPAAAVPNAAKSEAPAKQQAQPKSGKTKKKASPKLTGTTPKNGAGNNQKAAPAPSQPLTAAVTTRPTAVPMTKHWAGAAFENSPSAASLPVPSFAPGPQGPSPPVGAMPPMMAAPPMTVNVHPPTSGLHPFLRHHVAPHHAQPHQHQHQQPQVVMCAPPAPMPMQVAMPMPFSVPVAMPMLQQPSNQSIQASNDLRRMLNIG